MLLRRKEGVIALPLVNPDASHFVGLVVPDRETIPPPARELLEVAKSLALAAKIPAHTAQWVRCRAAHL